MPALVLTLGAHLTPEQAAVKRQFGLAKMLAAMESKAEAGVAKRLRMAGALNRQGRLLYFYGARRARSPRAALLACWQRLTAVA